MLWPLIWTISSDEGSQHMVSIRNKKNYPSIIIKYPNYLELFQDGQLT